MRVVDLDKALNRISTECFHHDDDSLSYHYIKAILLEYTIDQEQKNGYWKEVNPVEDGFAKYNVCSNCNDICATKYKYCPYCGAKMRKHRDDRIQQSSR